MFDLHRFLDLALHVFFVWHFPWRVGVVVVVVMDDDDVIVVAVVLLDFA